MRPRPAPASAAGSSGSTASSNLTGRSTADISSPIMLRNTSRTATLFVLCFRIAAGAGEKSGPNMLTRKQHELLRFIHERLRESGIPPSFDEMKDALDLKSKSGIHRLITALEERGFIRRLPNRARALEVLRLPENAGGNSRRFTPSVVEGGLGRSKTPVASPAEEKGRDLSIPVMGRIAAGT